jgi:hypothetical protein
VDFFSAPEILLMTSFTNCIVFSYKTRALNCFKVFCQCFFIITSVERNVLHFEQERGGKSFLLKIQQNLANDIGYEYLLGVLLLACVFYDKTSISTFTLFLLCCCCCCCFWLKHSLADIIVSYCRS